MNRRTFLASTGIAVSAPLCGCLNAATADQNGPPARPWPSSDALTNPDGTHHLFVENHTATTETAWLRVVREDGATIVDGRYELPDQRGIEFEDVAAWETTYIIDLAIDGDEATSLEWDTPACGSASEAPGDSGSRNAAVRVTEASDTGDERQMTLVVDQCDAIRSPQVSVGPADTFRLDE